MTKVSAPALAFAAFWLAGCAGEMNDLGRPPAMTPVGYGLPPATHQVAGGPYAVPVRDGTRSLWDESRADLFRDPRAQKVGDVITVNIQINDKASLDNTTDRSRNSKIGAGFDLSLAWGGYSKEGAAAGSLRSESAAKGQGTIDRSEKIQFSVGAVVTGVLPNGNLVISGSQEVRVNHELRLLHVAGIVRPRDVSRDNTIAYDKIAEARVSYGGRGRLTEVQQPRVGQQVYDNLAPF